MFYLERLTSSSSHSLAATIGYATSGGRAWRASLEPGDGGTAGRITLLAAPPAPVSSLPVPRSLAGPRRDVARSIS
ncbi:MAG: hypothetical protein AB7S87_02680 [Burkholderiales bacterium]